MSVTTAPKKTAVTRIDFSKIVEAPAVTIEVAVALAEAVEEITLVVPTEPAVSVLVVAAAVGLTLASAVVLAEAAGAVWATRADWMVLVVEPA